MKNQKPNSNKRTRNKIRIYMKNRNKIKKWWKQNWSFQECKNNKISLWNFKLNTQVRKKTKIKTIDLAWYRNKNFKNDNNKRQFLLLLYQKNQLNKSSSANNIKTISHLNLVRILLVTVMLILKNSTILNTL